ncbi:hypothetical protein SEVIR_3G270601v4 [Setaria viridis]
MAWKKTRAARSRIHSSAPPPPLSRGDADARVRPPFPRAPAMAWPRLGDARASFRDPDPSASAGGVRGPVGWIVFPGSGGWSPGRLIETLRSGGLRPRGGHAGTQRLRVPWQGDARGGIGRGVRRC